MTTSRVPMATVSNKNVWYLQFEGSEFGPLSIGEALVVIKSGKLKGKLFAWTPGYDAWKPIEAVSELSEVAELRNQVRRLDGPSDRRSARRVALLATVNYDSIVKTQSGAVSFVGICRDISEGGMQILGPPSAGGEGTLIHLEVTPLNSTAIKPFEALGKVCKVLPKDEGFGVQFRNLPDQSRQEILNHAAAVTKI